MELVPLVGRGALGASPPSKASFYLPKVRPDDTLLGYHHPIFPTGEWEESQGAAVGLKKESVRCVPFGRK